MKKADYIFETSWEICNKVGGIYTVLSTKAPTVVKQYQNNYICIGPDIPKEQSADHDFIEDRMLYKNWRESAAKEGLHIRIGRWQIIGNPIVILVDFTPFFEKKNEIFTQFWLRYKLDSIAGQWDYIEPALFGYAAAKVIESFYRFYCNARDHIIAQFHEWMTGTGVLHLKTEVPQIATVFTTHATVLGRCIAGCGLPLYSNMNSYNAQEWAQKSGVQSKFSLEYLSAQQADAFTTVSDITNRECVAFLNKKADVITINGFDNTFVPDEIEYVHKRNIARQRLLEIATALTQQEISDKALLVLNSGRYEFKNKGIDLFIQSLSQLQNENNGRDIVAFIIVPAGISGQRTDLKARLGQPLSESPQLSDYNTHFLHDFEHDLVITEIKVNHIDNAPNHNVKVIFAPIYLNGHDGIFNLSYYDVLIGFDLTVFPSYYEPWGYTPLESVAFGIPTITTSLTGFGLWAQANFDANAGVWTLNRNEINNDEVVHQISDVMRYFCKCSTQEIQQQQKQAFRIAQHATWGYLFDNYLLAYDIALEKSTQRYDQYKNKTSNISTLINQREQKLPHWKHITVKSKLTDNLKPLEYIAQNLWWSWNYEARELFQQIAGELWQKYEENPLYILQMLSYETIQIFSGDKIFIEKLNAVYQKFKDYINTPCCHPDRKVAYFSMEFGISNELKIFSGGLGMLAGDYLKEASDANVNMIAVGLLYRCGYFTQQISHSGDQLNIYNTQSFSKLPITPLRDTQGNFQKVSIALPGRMVFARIWQVNVGRIPLYLLDTDFSENTPEDRKITYNLYGGDNENRLKQELLLGIGGIRMLELLGEKPAVFHLNEGHAAFLSLERIRIIMQEKQLPLLAAIELVRSSSLYTTHTPVPAGHDTFSEDLMRIYFSSYPDIYHIDWNSFMAFGRKHIDCIYDKFSMSILACKLSQEINGVSRIHGRVSREMFAHLYEGFFPEELHIGYVTNGVHYPTWAHKKWQQYHAEIMGDDFKQDCANPLLWEKMRYADDNTIWQLKNELRKEMLYEIRHLLDLQMRRRNESPSLIINTIKAIDHNTLTIGFARRFATYKRAYLLFTSEERLQKLLNNPDRPVQFIFAGKAHPHDKAGQDLIKRIVDLSQTPPFQGKIIFLENYDMVLAKKLISGCDVWLNTPMRPLEASGTSGEKAIMNGVLNFSVLDGWWAEGYHPEAGWAIAEEATYSNDSLQDELDASILYDTIENQIVPTFYTRNAANCPLKWVSMMKETFVRIAPHFTMKRQLDDYYSRFYRKLDNRSAMLVQNDNELLSKLMHWKRKIIAAWDTIEIVQVHYPENMDNIYLIGDTLEVNVALRLGTLLPEDVKIELVFTVRNGDKKEYFSKYAFHVEKVKDDITTFVCRIDSRFSGTWDCAVRLIPANPLLPHDMDLNFVKWL